MVTFDGMMDLDGTDGRNFQRTRVEPVRKEAE